MIKEFKDIKKEIVNYFERVGLTMSSYYKFGYDDGPKRNDDVAYILFEDLKWKIVCYERGRSSVIEAFSHRQDLVNYFINLAIDLKVESLCGQILDSELDIRRCQYRKTLELLEEIKPEWVPARRRDILQEIKRRPYDDNQGVRWNFYFSLKNDKGMSHEEALTESEMRYPKPKPEENPEI